MAPYKPSYTRKHQKLHNYRTYCLWLQSKANCGFIKGQRDVGIPTIDERLGVEIVNKSFLFVFSSIPDSDLQLLSRLHMALGGWRPTQGALVAF